MSTYDNDIPRSAGGVDPAAGESRTSAASSSPEEIRRDIERTRGNLSRDVNALGEAVQPGNVARRQAQKVGGAAADLRDSIKERVMGSDDPYDASPGIGDRVGEATSGMGDRAQDAQQAVRRKAQGNPLAAGLIALGAGWLVGSMLPASEREQQLARTALDNTDRAQPLVDEVKTVAQDAADHLKQPAQEAVSAVQGSAQSAVDTVRTEGEVQVAQVKSSAQDSKDTVQQHQQDS